MRGLLIAATFVLLSLLPRSTIGLPSMPEPTPENGCMFAEAVLKEIAEEEARIHRELEQSTLARKVVLTVQIKSGENLRKETKLWEARHCIIS